jgi:hypothetical protein
MNKHCRTITNFTNVQRNFKVDEEHNVDVIVVGTRSMSGFAKQLLGSTALGVVTYTHCSYSSQVAVTIVNCLNFT